jgi:DNA polymerase III subunit delta
MKVLAKNTESFVKKPAPEALAILVYGPDEGLVRERLSLLTKHIVADVNDPFNVAEINASQLEETPSRLLDEAQSFSMMGGRRVIRVKDATDKITSTLKETLKVLRAGDNLILIEGAELGPRSTLRMLFEKEENAAALACYVDDERDIGRVIADGVRAQGYTISSEALTHMAANVVGDRAVARGEIDKLILYMGGFKQIDLEDAIACVGNSATLSMDVLCRSVASGQFAEGERVLKSVMSDGAPAVTVLRALQSYFTRLHLTKARVVKGDNLEIAMKKLKPEVFFKNKSAFEAQIFAWGLPQIEQALVLLMTVEGKCKQTGSDPELLCSRAMLSLSQMASRVMNQRRRA